MYFINYITIYSIYVCQLGLYYLPKDKVKTLKELVCLATFDTNEVYLGVNWKKKYKSPTDYCFAIKHPRLQQPKSVKFIKFLCADDQRTLERWITAMRIAKVYSYFIVIHIKSTNFRRFLLENCFDTLNALDFRF